MKKFLLFIILLTISSVCAGQQMDNDQPGENWFLDYGFRESPIIYYRYDNYSKEDISKFKEKKTALKDAPMSDEWEGAYGYGGYDMVGFSQLRWDSKAGFLSFYIYTCTPELKHIDYGSVVNSRDFLLLTPQVAADSPRKAEPVKYIKVRWGEGHYLVAESSLSDFAEKAVGIFAKLPAPGKYNWENFWFSGDLGKPLTGSPVFPDAYKKFARRPIEASIIFVGKRAVKRNVGTGNAYYTADTAFYTVTINAGKNKGVKKNMNFDLVESPGDEVFITRVNQRTAVGVVARAIDDEGADFCRNYDNEIFPCPPIKPSFSVKTQLGRFYF